MRHTGAGPWPVNQAFTQHVFGGRNAIGRRIPSRAARSTATRVTPGTRSSAWSKTSAGSFLNPGSSPRCTADPAARRAPAGQGRQRRGKVELGADVSRMDRGVHRARALRDRDPCADVLHRLAPDARDRHSRGSRSKSGTDHRRSLPGSVSSDRRRSACRQCARGTRGARLDTLSTSAACRGRHHAGGGTGGVRGADPARADDRPDGGLASGRLTLLAGVIPQRLSVFSIARALSLRSFSARDFS